MSKALRAPDYLGHVLSALGRIERHTAGVDESTFLASELIQAAADGWDPGDESRG